MSQARTGGDTIVDGWVLANGYRLASGGTPMAASAQEHQHSKTVEWAGNEYQAPAAARRVIHNFVGSAGTLRACAIGSRMACVGNSTVTIDVQKNGVTVLTTPIILDSTNTAYLPEDAVLAVTSCVDGDVIEAVVSYSLGTGTLALGLFATLMLNEDYV